MRGGRNWADGAAEEPRHGVQAGSAGLAEDTGIAERMAGVGLVPVGWDALAGWRQDDHRAALGALLRTARHVARNGPHRSAVLGPTGEELVAASDAIEGALAGPQDARAYLETRFTPLRIVGHGAHADLGGPEGTGFVTGFYEPDLAASPVRDADHPYPIHAVPPGLVKNDGSGTAPPSFAWAMRGADGRPAAAPDREEIERVSRPANPPGTGAANPPGTGAANSARTGAAIAQWPVIAWAADRVDLFFAHVQGAARLVMTDGTVRRITYAAKSGHPFTAIGAELVAMGAIERGAVTMRSIRDWLAAHPARVDDLLRRNRSYIFFREVAPGEVAPDEVAPDEVLSGGDASALGPIAAARVPLTPGRSLAVDRLLHTFGTPIHVHAPGLSGDDRGTRGDAFARLMIAQETGTAIRGAARGDIFTGSGEAAGERAGGIAHSATFTMLAPRGPATERLLNRFGRNRFGHDDVLP